MHLSDTVLLVGEEDSVLDDPNAEPRWIGRQLTIELATWKICGSTEESIESFWTKSSLSSRKTSRTQDQVRKTMNLVISRMVLWICLRWNQVEFFTWLFDPVLRHNWGLGESSLLQQAVQYELEGVFRNSSSLRPCLVLHSI